MSEQGDWADRASALTERETEDCITAARMNGAYLEGPSVCGHCARWNDRAGDGYAVCSACLEELADG